MAHVLVRALVRALVLVRALALALVRALALVLVRALVRVHVVGDVWPRQIYGPNRLVRRNRGTEEGRE